MTPLVRALSSALLHFLWQGVVVALVLSVALVLLRKRSAQARYVASCAALAIMAGLPAITMAVLYRAPAAVQAAGGAVMTQAGAVAFAVPTGSWTMRLDAWALPLWSLGVLFFAVRLVWGSREVSALRRRGEPADSAVVATAAAVAARLGLSRPVHVLISSLTEGPSVVGWMKPVILLPAATLAGLTPQQFEAVLAHEIAHILRYDYLINLLQMLVEALLFYHPAVWWVSSRIRHERELCCDDLAVRACGDAVCYARALTTLERLRASAPALAMGSTGGRLLYRIERLMGAAPQEQAPARWPGIVALAAGLACLAVTTNWALGQAPMPPDQPGVKVELGKSSVVNRTGVGYPAEAQKKGVKGNVTVQVTVDENGDVSDAKVTNGPEELRKSVLQSVLNWHFSPDAAKSKRQVKVEFQPPPPGAEPQISTGIENSDERPIEEMKAALENLKATAERQSAMLAEQQVRMQVQLATAARQMRDVPEVGLQAVEEQLLEAQKQIRNAQRQDLLPQQYEAQAQIERAKRQVEVAQAQLAEARAAQERAVQMRTEGRAQLDQERARQAAIQAQVEALKARADEARALGSELSRQQGSRQIVGRTIKNIQMVGFTAAVRLNLTAGLKLRMGDALTPESIEAVRKTIREYDENVLVEFIPTNDGQVELRITEVGARR